MELNLQPLAGEMESQVFENSNAGVPRSVYFNIDIPIAPFKFDGEDIETSVRLDLIDFGITDWRLLEGKTFSFPVNPTPGYIDGSMYLGHAHNPADVTRAAFGQFRGSSVLVELDIQFDFTYEGPSHLGKPSVHWRVELVFDTESLDVAHHEFTDRS